LTETPNDKQLNGALGICFLKLKLHDKALPFFEKAMEDNFADPNPYYYAAVCLLKGKKAFLAMRPEIDAMERYLEAAINLEPKGIFYYFRAYIKYDYYGYRTEEQEKALFYFSDKNKKGCVARLKGCFRKKEKTKGCFKINKKGCFPKKMKYVSDAEYDTLVKTIAQRLDPENRGLQKIGLDRSQIEKTISFDNYVYKDVFDEVAEGDLFFWKIGDDDKFRSSIYEVTYLFFTQNEIAAYQLTLSSDWEKHDEETFEYHYKDITALKTKTLQKDKIKDGKKEYQTVQNEFFITVPGDSFSVTLGNKPTSEEENTIQAMKALLRERKA